MNESNLFYEPNNKINISSNSLNFQKKDLEPKLRKFFKNIYYIISKDNYDRIIKKDEDEHEKEKEINHLIKLINQIIVEKNNDNCKMKFLFQNSEINMNNKKFILNLEVIHKVHFFNELLKMKIIFNVIIEMFFRSGNSLITFSTCTFNYQDKQEVIIKPNLTCLLINNNLGNYSLTYCTCGDCRKCKNHKKEKPFDDLLLYLRKENKINYEPEYTQLWFGKYNSYNNNSDYNCSFCYRGFFKKKLNIVRLYCIDDTDHSCIFWICRDCYKSKSRISKQELCPNCEKFIVDFTRLKSIFRFRGKKK